MELEETDVWPSQSQKDRSASRPKIRKEPINFAPD